MIISYAHKLHLSRLLCYNLQTMTKKVYVGMSGGVDSSVTAALLKKSGCNVVGVYMKNWSQDLPGFPCPWKEDYQDAKRVAVQLGIDFKLYDFEKQYRRRVVDYMVDGFKAGITPNPDIMCNQEIKFKLFLETALGEGANLVATGHYARTKNGKLYKAKDDNKDQTYFLSRVSEEALKKTIFPLGDYTKPQVRELAKKFVLVTAAKKESMGICFVGKVGIKDFLLNELGPQKPGKIIDQADKTVGEHDGAIFYTVGQRHGLDIGRRLPAGRQGGLPYYVVGKDMDKNEVYVTTNLDDKKLWREIFNLTSLHWINKPPKTSQKLSVRTRHRASLENCTVELKGKKATVKLNGQLRALTPGQSAVFYDGDQCLGGGVII